MAKKRSGLRHLTLLTIENRAEIGKQWRKRKREKPGLSYSILELVYLTDSSLNTSEGSLLLYLREEHRFWT